MLRTVIFKGAADVGHQRDEENVADEDADADQPLAQRLEDAERAARKPEQHVQPLGCQRRQHKKQPDAQHHAEETGNAHDRIHHLVAEGLCQPFFKLGFRLVHVHPEGVR